MARKKSAPSARWISGVVLTAVALLVGALTLGWYRSEVGDKGDGLLSTPVTTIGGEFSLLDTESRPFTDKDLAGKPYAMFFGFTYCPDVCPTTLWDVSQWLEALGPEADRLNFVYVSVDPERDTPEQMKSYLSAFNPRIIGLTGPRENVDKILAGYRVYAQRVELDSGDYTMDHTATIYLMDAEGRFAGTIAYQEKAENALTKLRKLIGVE
ncbi:MAG TPA: SCO family protein [Hyphomicrobiales bacterium]|nr:SCO family protein [Kaistiaceae bacterium]HQF30894.1 SCO family protein [Hyphomicrobiales bacterium]